MIQKRCCSDLKDSPAKLKVCVAGFKETCLFFRKKGEKFSIGEMVPEGVCPDLFFQIYPRYLSLMYESKTKDVILRCPGKEGKTYWKVKSKKLLLSPFINLLNMVFRLIGVPKDFFEKKIIIELIKTEGTCPRGYTEKTKFFFNQYSHLWKRRFFCPAAFYTLYPFLLNALDKQKGQIDRQSITVQCPSDHTSILFEITK